jgi:hypothetical protein
VVDYENNHIRMEGDKVMLADGDILAIYSVHLFLHDVNRGGGLAFLLHSTTKEEDLRLQEDHGRNLVRVGHSASHIWAAIHQMRWTQAMLFCVGHTEGRLCPHAAFPVDDSTPGYKARRSLEVKFAVRERRRTSNQRVTPVPILVAQPAVAPQVEQPAEVKQRGFEKLKGKIPGLFGGKGKAGKPKT